MAELIYLSYIAIILIIGIFAIQLSKKIKISKFVLFLFFGMLIGNLQYKGAPLIKFSNSSFLVSISVLALVMVVFDGSSRFKLKELDNFYSKAIKLSLSFLIISLIIITPITFFMFKLSNFLLALLFAVIISSTDPTAMFELFKEKNNHVVSMLEIESILNTLIMVIGTFVILDMIKIQTLAFSSLINQITPLMLQLTVGVGTGIIIGIIFFKNMRKNYDEQISPLILIAASLVAYILAENMGGNGVLSVATLGLFFGNVYIKEKAQLQEFSSTLSKTLEILVFMILGIMIKIDFNPIFLLKSILLFLIFILVRFLSVKLIFFNKEFNNKEVIFMSLNIPKGITVAVIIFTISVQSMIGFDVVLNLIFLFMIYSLILSSIISNYSKKFIRIKIKQ